MREIRAILIPSTLMRREIKTLLKEMRAAGDVSAAVAVVSRPDEEIAAASVGLPPGAKTRARFDFGSLTKPFMATLAISEAWTEGLPLDFPLGDGFPDIHPDLANKTVEDLLRHRAGFRPWFPFYATCSSGEEVRDRLVSGEGLLGAEPGTYSDLDYLLWGFLFDDFHPSGLEGALSDQVLSWLELATVTGPPGQHEDVVPCQLDNGKEIELAAGLGIEVKRENLVLKGKPQDGNARFLGGVPGHAGLFGTAEDLVRLGAEWLDPRLSSLAEAKAVALAGDGPYVLGWQRRDEEGGAGPLSDSSFGHYGFPGGSLWIDPESGLIWVLLAHKTRSDVDLTPWRRRFHGLGADL